MEAFSHSYTSTLWEMETAPLDADPRRSSRRTRAQRVVGTGMIAVGFLTLLWAVVVWQWNDPFTSAYTRWQQRSLVGEHERVIVEFRLPRPLPASATPAEEAAAVARAARKLRRRAGEGAPIGRIVVPRLDLNMLVVNGTTTSTLKRGPGRDERTFMPGQGELVYIAGHRTTYRAPLSKIDTMRPGDRVTLEMPYATFTYVVTGRSIVRSNDLSVLRSQGEEVVALQACHPRFFAKQRYIVWAKIVRIAPAGGKAYTPT